MLLLVHLSVLCQQVGWTMLLSVLSFMSTGQWLVLLVHLSVCFMSTGRVVSVTGASVCVLYVNRSDG